jgi:hypothetical protein
MFLLLRMRFLVSGFVFVMLWQPLAARERSISMDAGFFAGTSYFFGDVEPRKHFHWPALAFGGVGKISLNPFLSARGTLTYGELRGLSLDYDPTLTAPGGTFYRFRYKMIHASAGLEYYFLPHLDRGYQRSWTPYIFAGVGWTAHQLGRPSFYEGPVYGRRDRHNFTLPFGLGVRVRCAPRISVGAEWALVKTFDDTLDYTLDPGHTGSSFNLSGNDWFGFAGMYITYRIFQPRTPCPAYD